MKRILSIFCLIFCVSCISDNTIDVETIPDFQQGSIEARAVKLMEDFYGPTTRASNRTPSVYTISVKTRSNDEVISTNVVNFDENQGFVVLTTNNLNEDNLLAISNNGNINAPLLERAILDPDSISEVSDTTLTIWGGELFEENEIDDDEDEPYYDSDPTYSSETFIPFITNDQTMNTASYVSPEIRFVEYYIADYIRNDCYITIDGNVSTGGGGQSAGGTVMPQWGSWEFYSGKEPLIKTKWHQSSPYNDDCPIKKGKRAPAGCVAIATGQVAAYFKRPASENWSLMSSFGVYDTTSYSYNEPYSSYTTISEYIHSLGKKLWMNYGATGSGSSIYRAKSYVRNHMKFDARIHKWNWDRVRDRLNKDIPVYTCGKGPEGGHAWIVDGYIIQYRKDQNNVYSNQYRTLVHMNWGWGHGTYDGYYLLGVFDPTTSPIQYDANVGDNGSARSDNVKFTKKIKTLTWSAE